MKKILVLGLMFTPMLALAQVVGAQNLTGIVAFLKATMGVATVLILSLAVVYFLWNTFKFVMAGGDEEGKNDGRKGMIAGIIGIAVMVSLWGLVNILTETAGVEGTNSTFRNAPVLQTQ